jgi:hypothetical protein
LQQAVMELASVMTHRLHLFDPSFSRKCTHIRFTAKFLSVRCSAAETRARSMDDEWEGSARLSIVQEKLQNIPQRMPEKPPTGIQSDEPSKDSEESVVPSVQSETPKVTGKTRGEIFLERSKEMLEVHSERSSARAIKTMERRIRKTEKGAVAKRTEPCCYGCGTILQTSAVEAPGYVPIDTFEVVRKRLPFFFCFDLFSTFLFQMFILQFSEAGLSLLPHAAEEKASSVEDYPLWQMCFAKSRPHDPCSQWQWRLWEWQRVCFCGGTPVSAFTSAV